MIKQFFAVITILAFAAVFVFASCHSVLHLIVFIENFHDKTEMPYNFVMFYLWQKALFFSIKFFHTLLRRIQ